MATVVSTLEQCFDKPLKKLTDLQRKIAITYVPKWYSMAANERRARAEMVDKQRSLKVRIKLSRKERQQNEEQQTVEWKNGELIGFFDCTLSANSHLKSPDVLPTDAAMVLCGHDPRQKETLEKDWANYATDPVDRRVLQIGPADLQALIGHFEAVVRTDPKHRTLIDWWRVARVAKLKYHPWVDQYIDAAGLDAPADTATPGPSPEAAGGTPDAGVVVVPANTGADAVAAGAGLAPSLILTPARRNKANYNRCKELGLDMPTELNSSGGGNMPRGFSEAAKKIGMKPQSLRESVVKHLEKLGKNAGK